MKIKFLILAFSILLPVSLFSILPSPAYASGQGEQCDTDGDCNTGNCANNACAGCDQISNTCMPRSAEGNDCIRTSDCMVGLECGAGGVCVRPAQPNQPPQQNAGGGAVQQLPNPLGAGTTIPDLIARVIKAAVGLVGSVGLLMFLYGGFTWMTAGGNDKKVEQGKQVLTWAVLGLIVIFTSYAVLSFVIERLTTSTSGNNIEQNQPQP